MRSGDENLAPPGRNSSWVIPVILWVVLIAPTLHVASVLALSVWGPLYSGSIQSSCTFRSHDAFAPEASVVSDRTAISLIPLGLNCIFLSPSSGERVGTLEVDDWSDTLSAGVGVLVVGTAASVIVARGMRATGAAQPEVGVSPRS